MPLPRPQRSAGEQWKLRRWAHLLSSPAGGGLLTGKVTVIGPRSQLAQSGACHGDRRAGERPASPPGMPVARIDRVAARASLSVPTLSDTGIIRSGPTAAAAGYVARVPAASRMPPTPSSPVPGIASSSVGRCAPRPARDRSRRRARHLPDLQAALTHEPRRVSSRCELIIFGLSSFRLGTLRARTGAHARRPAGRPPPRRRSADHPATRQEG